MQRNVQVRYWLPEPTRLHDIKKFVLRSTCQRRRAASPFSVGSRGPLVATPGPLSPTSPPPIAAIGPPWTPAAHVGPTPNIPGPWAGVLLHLLIRLPARTAHDAGRRPALLHERAPPVFLHACRPCPRGPAGSGAGGRRVYRSDNGRIPGPVPGTPGGHVSSSDCYVSSPGCHVIALKGARHPAGLSDGQPLNAAAAAAACGSQPAAAGASATAAGGI